MPWGSPLVGTEIGIGTGLEAVVACVGFVAIEVRPASC